MLNTHEILLKLRSKEKQITCEILQELQNMENKRGYLQLGYSSLFDYLVRGLGYSESTAYQRQSCLRLCESMPEIKEKIKSGVVSFTTLTMVFKETKGKTRKEKREIIKSIEGKSSREVKQMFVEPAMAVKVKEQVYKDKVHLRLELSHDQFTKIKKLRSLKSHSQTMESLFENLIDKELKKFENIEFKKADSNNPRYIPKRLRNYVLKKAKYRCQFQNCEATEFLQIDHIRPVRTGGKASADNLQVLCSAHNRFKG